MLLAALCGLLCVGIVHGDSGFVLDAYTNVAADLAENVNAAESSGLSYAATVTDHLMQAVHENGPAASYIADKANFVSRFANVLNAKSIQDMTFENFADLTQRISYRINDVCPLNQYYDVDCSVLDLTNRPINNICNNLEHPHWGSAKIAQLRLAPAWWENVVRVTSRANVVNRLDVVDPIGVNIISSERLIFRLRGNSGFRLVVLSPSETCDEVKVASLGTTTVEGAIVAAAPSGKNYEVCSEGKTFTISGNAISVTEDCEGPFKVCYQPVHIEVDIGRTRGDVSTLKVDGTVLANYEAPETLYSSSDPRPFWIRITNRGIIKVGYGTECDDRTTILECETPIASLLKSLLSFRYSVAVGVLDNHDTPRVVADFPVSDNVILETDLSSIRNLRDYPFLFDDGSLRFGIERFRTLNSYTVQIYDDENNARVFLDIGSTNTIRYFLNGTRQVTLEIEDVPVPRTIPHFEDGSGVVNNPFDAFWVSWIEGRVYVGIGNVVGKLSSNKFLSLNSDQFKFKPTRVVLSSDTRVRWIFDIVQFSKPRSSSLTGAPLPSARDVSLGVHTNIGGTTEWSSRLTMAVMQMGQFIDHDIIATPAEEVNHEPIICCVGGVPVPTPSRFCFNIDITSATDPNGSQGEFPDSTFQCMPFVRSSATLNCDLFDPLRDLRSREQLNVLTSYVDGSNIYGSEPEEAEELRELADHSGARLASTEEGRELPTTTEEGEAACNNGDRPDFLCHRAGDFRVSEQPGLSSIHTLWLREHNRVVDELLNLGFRESTVDEREELFQQARRIVIAEYQNVVYQGYLRSFIDDEIFNDFQLGNGQCDYNPAINAGVFNEWGIANRIGHTWVNNFLVGTSSESLLENFFNPTITHVNGSDVLIRNLYQTRCPETDRTLETAITENLFRDGADALDLASLNIQRGRDHGVSYCRTREALGLPVPRNFNQAVNRGIFTQETVNLLENVYECVCDIDLFTAIVAEQPMSQRFSASVSPVGETLNHIQALFFHNAKCGDRYWHEFQDARFTAAQQAAIQQVTMSRIICDNTDDVEDIQVDSFLRPSGDNPTTSCDDTDSIPQLDLSLFRKRRFVITDTVLTPIELEPNLQTARESDSETIEEKKIEQPVDQEIDESNQETERQLDNEIRHLLEVLKDLEQNEE